MIPTAAAIESAGSAVRAIPEPAAPPLWRVTSARRRLRLDDGRLSVAAAVLTIGAVCGLACTIGADARWLAALGRIIEARARIPAGVPFASAPSGQWPNAIALGELIFHWLEAAFGDRGFMIAQLAAVVGGFSLLASDAMLSGATASGTALTLVLLAIGALPSFAIARSQLFSLILFPALLAVLRSDARAKSGRIWLCIPLLALWSNLHGAAIIGLGITLVYLSLSWRREHPGSSFALGAAASLALCVTPVGVRTVSYYHGVLTNVAAQRGEGLWSPLSLGSPFDVVLILVVLILAVCAIPAWRGRPPLWELASLVALSGLTIQSDRAGVWLLMFLVGPASRRISLKPSRRSASVVITVLAAILAALTVVRGPLPNGARAPLVAGAITIAHGRPILASDVIAEQIALAGGRVWLSNPIDAFSTADQAVYLDWLAGAPHGGHALGSGVDVVLVDAASPAGQLMARTAGFRLVRMDHEVGLYVRSG
jgi:hypothetical protein